MSEKPPNVIVILTDDQGYGDFSCHGNPVLRTPHLDDLYGQSVRFTDFHVAPMCTPSRGQIMTGLDALRNGATAVKNGRSFVRRGIPTMADIFTANGYRTGLFGKWHLGDNAPFRPENRGFSEALWHPSAAISTVSDYWNNDCFNDYYRHNGTLKQYEGYCTDVWFREAKKWIEGCARKKEPFFAYIATNADHTPHFVPDRYRDPYRRYGIYVASFFGMIANVDENVGMLDAFLQETGLSENTVLVFMTDNGGTVGVDLYNAGMRGEKSSLYDGGHRVPCFIRWPAGSLRTQEDVSDTAQCQDLLPTLIDLCGLEAEDGGGSDGCSWAGVMRKDDVHLPDRMLVVQHGEPEKWESCVIWNNWRLVRGEELYNVAEDLLQKQDLSSRCPEIVDRMREHYEDWWEGLGTGVMDLEDISVGSDSETTVCLSHIDWQGPILGYQGQMRTTCDRSGKPTRHNGSWRLEVEQNGEYEIALRRWPKEADARITGTVPEYIPTDSTFVGMPRPPEGEKYTDKYALWAWISGTFPVGRALPISGARARIGEMELTRPVAPEDRACTFTVRLNTGRTTLRTWFSDEGGNELCGAFYCCVTRKR